ncbi:amino acid ABC transporter substrate-binding protein [Ruegeria sp. AD91A]|uniref:amino acid ABC transporter substrate-binding protein n=1 Tax=Ruegeria sp. AD91A TaxID=2293862 RepID=UPI000E487331|nr:amino acid ABC transporter substrate-binding protein [Ruegeria sp. AD91A]AXT25574.1 amino acid ABC transporter substrate-binding protein [Ruegeria sp. AD91A]
MRLLPIFIVTVLFTTGAVAQTIDRITKNNEIRFGFRTDAAPLSYINNQGRPFGLSPLICDQVAKAIAKKLELKDLNVQFIPVDAKDRFDKVASGEVDMLCGAATITLSRREIVDFSIPIYVDGTSVLLPIEAAGTMGALAGKKIGMRSNTTTEASVQNSFKSAGIDAAMVRFASHPDGIKALRDGEIDAYFADQSILLVNYISAGLKGKFKLSQEILTIEKQGLAIARGDDDFRLFVDSVLSEMYAQGTMEEIFRLALPGVEPSEALKALYVIAPINP